MPLLKLNVIFNFVLSSRPSSGTPTRGTQVPAAETLPPPPVQPAETDCRCLCGSLVARRVPEGVELKCRRCKRTLLVPLEAGETREVVVA